jgi:hypothetical protein
MTELAQQSQIGRWQRSKQLTQSAWIVLKLDKKLATLPIIGALAGLGTLIAGGIVVIGLFAWISNSGNNTFTRNDAIIPVVLIVLGIIFVLGQNFIGSLINGAIFYGALERFEGRDATLKNSLAAAWQKARPLFWFSLLAGTVGLVLRFIERRLPFAAGIIVWIFGNAFWSVASLFSIPFIMTEKEPLGPIDATQKSVGLIKKVWGESVLVSIGVGLIGLVSTLAYLIVGIPLLIATNAVAGSDGAAGVGFIEFLGLMALFMILNVLSAIAKTAVFYWATTGRAPANFNQELLRSALTPKKARKIFV